MKSISSKDPRKKEIVTKLKELSGGNKVTKLKEDNNYYYGDCMKYSIVRQNYDWLGLFKIEKPYGKTSEVKPKKDKVINGKTAEEFIDFLEGTLIPDLKESGSTYTAEDFETAIKWIKHFKG